MTTKKVSKFEAGKWFRERREARGLTQGQVYEALGLPLENYMTHYERGTYDVRRSKYIEQFLKFYGVTDSEAREFLGMDLIILGSGDTQASTPRRGVMLRFLGQVQAAMPDKVGGSVERYRGKQIECPLSEAHAFPSSELFVLEVDGDSMADPEIKSEISNGSKILCRKIISPSQTYPRQIVVAYIPELDMAVLKVMTKNGHETVLESYNQNGARFPARKYPKMRLQAVVIGSWKSFSQ